MKPLLTVPKIHVQFTRPKISEMPKIEKSAEAAALFRTCYEAQQIDFKEFFYVMFLTRNNHVLGVANIGMGSQVQVTINLKELFQIVLETNCAAIVLCHNHPSGELKPSKADIELTKRVEKFAEMIDVQLIDHIILTSESFYSFG